MESVLILKHHINFLLQLHLVAGSLGDTSSLEWHQLIREWHSVLIEAWGEEQRACSWGCALLLHFSAGLWLGCSDPELGVTAPGHVCYTSLLAKKHLAEFLHPQNTLRKAQRSCGPSFLPGDIGSPSRIRSDLAQWVTPSRLSFKFISIFLSCIKTKQPQTTTKFLPPKGWQKFNMLLVEIIFGEGWRWHTSWRPTVIL